MRDKILAIAALLVSFAAPAMAQNPDLTLNPGSAYVDAGRAVDWGTQFNRTYVIVPNSPNASICIYVVNNNPTSAHSFTTAVFQSADSQVPNFSSNGSRFSSVTVQGMPASVPALTMVSGFVQSTAAAKVAIKFSAAISQAGSPDNADIFLVQTTTGTCGTTTTALAVQGAVAQGSSLTQVNPLAIGGKTAPTDASPNQSQFVTVFPQQLPTATLNIFGVVIGAGNINGTNSSAGVTYPNSGPMASALFAQVSSSVGGNAQPLAVSASLGGFGTTGAGTAGQSLSGLLVENNGYTNLTTPQTIAASGNQLITTNPWNFGTWDSCYVTVTSSTPTGTTPTLDVYFQTSMDGASWQDRIHFAQLTGTASTLKQVGGISAHVSTGVTPLTTAPIQIQNANIAVSTIVNGPIGGWLRFQWVIGGTTPQYTNVQFGIACH